MRFFTARIATATHYPDSQVQWCDPDDLGAYVLNLRTLSCSWRFIAADLGVPVRAAVTWLLEELPRIDCWTCRAQAVRALVLKTYR